MAKSPPQAPPPAVEHEKDGDEIAKSSKPSFKQSEMFENGTRTLDPEVIKIITRRIRGEGARTANAYKSGVIRGDSRRPPYVNPSNRPPPDRDKIRRVRYDKGCRRTNQDKTRRVPDVKGCPTYQDKTPQDSRIISGSRGGVPRDKGCVNQNGLRKGVLDIGYLGIRACARMRTQYSFGAKHARVWREPMVLAPSASSLA